MSNDSPYGLPLKVDMPNADPAEWIEEEGEEEEEE